MGVVLSAAGALLLLFPLAGAGVGAEGEGGLGRSLPGEAARLRRGYAPGDSIPDTPPAVPSPAPSRGPATTPAAAASPPAAAPAPAGTKDPPAPPPAPEPSPDLATSPSADGGVTPDAATPQSTIDPELRARLEALEAQNDLLLNNIGNRQAVLQTAIINVGRPVSGGQMPPVATVKDLFKATGEMVVSQVLRHDGTVHFVSFSTNGNHLVTACSVCNGRKGGRSLEESGMVLSPMPHYPLQVATFRASMFRRLGMSHPSWDKYLPPESPQVPFTEKEKNRKKGA